MRTTFSPELAHDRQASLDVARGGDRGVADELERDLDLPWCSADEFYAQKLSLVLRAASDGDEP
jgi:hypothetical protein